jgi:integrase
MGAIFRKTAYRPVPTAAIITTSKEGNTTAKWTPRKANRSIVAPVRTLADGRRVIEVATGCYYARFRGTNGKVRTVSTGCRDESAARQFLANQERRVERVKAGIMTRQEANAAARLNDPIDEHFDAYVDRLPSKRGGQATSLHRGNTRRYLRRLAADCRWSCLADLTRHDLERWMATETGKRRSARSINCHRAAAVAFANWCADPNIGRLPANPFGTGRSGVQKADEDADHRRRRRAFAPDELRRLIDAARTAPKQRSERDTRSIGQAPVRLTGRNRADLWAFLAGTGLRVGEVKRLTVADVRLEAVPPHVRVSAAIAKSRKEQTVPLRSDLVAMMRRRLAERKPNDRIFEIPVNLIERFNADCRRAGIAKRDAEGRTIDIHSLRTTFGTYLALSGVTPRIAMELMRHSRIDLTMSVYTDPRLLPLAEAIEATSSVVTKVVTTADSGCHSLALHGTDEQVDAPSTEVA